MGWGYMTEIVKTTLTKASQLLRSARRPLLICHVSPDGDAIGSLIGLGAALTAWGLNPILACSDPVPWDLAHVPGADSVVQDVAEFFDLVISLDCSDLERLGSMCRLPDFRDRPLINIDHHQTNTSYGDVNLVDASASSTAEVVLRLLDRMSLPIDEQIATCLLTGIVTDTRGFRTSNVNVQVMEAATRLMKAGAPLPFIAGNSLDCRSTSVIRLWGAAISRLQLEDDVIWTSIPQEMRQATGYAGNGDAGLANFLISSRDAVVAVVFAESEDGSVEVGLRAVSGFDVSQVALQFGGGGHLLASGCSIFGTLKEAETRVLTAVRDDLARQRQNRT